MSNVLDPQNALKHRVALAILSLTTFIAIFATILHRLQPHPHPLDLIAPPVFAVASVALLICLYKKPASLPQVTHIGLLGAVVCVVFPSWVFTFIAFTSPRTTLVGILPPITSLLFLLTMVMLIYLRPQRLLYKAILAWVFSAVPILTYLILHPAELITSRGLDLAISLEPAMAIQIVLILFYNRLQDLVDHLYSERLQYYAQIVERQGIRQQAMEHAFTQIHNGPLQTLALLLRDVRQEQISSQQLLQRLEALNQEIRAVGHSLTDIAEPQNPSAPELITLKTTVSDHILRLGEGTCLDMSLPKSAIFSVTTGN